MNRLTYHVGMGPDGKPHVSVSSEDPDAPANAIPWVKATYERMTTAAATPEPQQIKADALTEEPPTCQVHQVSMVGVNGRRGFFWSCHTRNGDGTWCSYRPLRP